MKIVKFLLKGLVFVVGILLAVWFFMPWQQVGEYALLRAAQQLKAPAAITYAAVDGVSGGFIVKDLDVRGLMGMVNLSCKTLKITPDLFASVMGVAPTCHIAFTGNALGEITILRKKIPAIYIGDGGVTISLGRREILLEGLRSNGDLSMNGVLALAPRADRVIAWSDVMLNVKSEAFEKELPSLQQALGLPLQQESPGKPGQWVLRRARPGTQKEAQPAQ